MVKSPRRRAIVAIASSKDITSKKCVDSKEKEAKQKEETMVNAPTSTINAVHNAKWAFSVVRR